MTLPDPRDAERPRDLYGEIRDAYAAYVEAETAQGSTRLYPRSCFEAGYLARDAEVARLREALKKITHEYETAGNHGADGIDVIADLAYAALGPSDDH